MNTRLILRYGNKEVEKAYKDFPKASLVAPGACGTWSVKDILAHIASYEHLLEEVLASQLSPAIKTPYMEDMKKSYAGFNDTYVGQSQKKSFDEIMKDYTITHQKVINLFEKFTPEKLREAGTIPWYGEEYALDDYIVYSNYGHKKEHMAQVSAFRDTIKG